jgi:hypothetical protein
MPDATQGGKDTLIGGDNFGSGNVSNQLYGDALRTSRGGCRAGGTWAV